MTQAGSNEPPAGGGRTKRNGPELRDQGGGTSRQGPETASARGESQPQGNNMLKELARTANDVVTRAVSILEEEIAVGVAAAKNVESRFVDVQTTRSGKPEEVLPRFRRDAHDAVDILMDLVGVATRTVDSLTQSAIRIGGEPAPGGRPRSTAAATIPTLSPAQAAHAGTMAELSMSLENDGDSPTEQFAFHATDLVSPAGGRIAASQISFSPDSLVIPPHDRAQLVIKITIPEDVSAGVYTGVLQATRLSQLRAMVLVPIE